MDGTTFLFSLFSSAKALNDFILTFNSKPISTTREFKNIIIIITMIVPIEPYNILYLLKLFTKAENAMVDVMLSAVANKAPGVNIFHRFEVGGAYL